MPERHGSSVLPPVVAFANDWASGPTSNHHVMSRLAAHTPVLWVETTGMRSPNLVSASDWRRVVAKLRRMGGTLRAGAPGMTVLSPPALPFPTSRIARRLNAWLYQRSLHRAISQLGWKQPPYLWVFIPTAARFLDGLDWKGMVYHCIDRWWAFEYYDSQEMRACHEILCARADQVFVSARDLLADCTSLTNKVRYIPHGVDWNHFHKAVEASTPRPFDLPETGRAVIGFIGLIDTWVDLDLLADLATANPDADVVLIGASRVPTDRIARLPNVRLLGRKSFAELPAYLSKFTVALVPFRVNELTLAVNPIKLREYLSAGVPVVSTALPELLAFRDEAGVEIAETREEFHAAVSRLLKHPATAEERLALSERMRGESWEGRLKSMFSQLGWAESTSSTESY